MNLLRFQAEGFERLMGIGQAAHVSTLSDIFPRAVVGNRSVRMQFQANLGLITKVGHIKGAKRKAHAVFFLVSRRACRVSLQFLVFWTHGFHDVLGYINGRRFTVDCHIPRKPHV